MSRRFSRSLASSFCSTIPERKERLLLVKKKNTYLPYLLPVTPLLNRKYYELRMCNIPVPRAMILLASATDRELRQGPKVGSPRFTDFRLSVQPQKFETIAVTIGCKNGQLLRLRVILAPARAHDPWRWPKGSQLWGRECGEWFSKGVR